ncbi:MAG TPA: hypothetical protein VGM03_16345 [Phycisphaerae bacterium]
MLLKQRIARLSVAAVLFATTQVLGQFEISWFTVDAGGAINTTGGTFDLSGTAGQSDAGSIMTGGTFTLAGGFWTFAGGAGTNVTITAANPPTPAENPYQPGQPYMDVLDTGTGSTVTAGIGAPGTSPQGAIVYSPIRVTFSAPPNPAPLPGNITVTCTGGSQPCPSVMAVTPGASSGEYQIALSGGIPPLSCTTLNFSGTAAGQRLQYRSHPGNVSLDMATNTQDLLALVQALNNGTANLPANFARYNVNRSTESPPVNTQDLLRLVQLLNGVATTQAFNGTTAAQCPP